MLETSSESSLLRPLRVEGKGLCADLISAGSKRWVAVCNVVGASISS
jgi:hypothetical protein